MLQVRNTTPFKVRILGAADPDGVESVYVIVKATYTIKPGGVLETAPAAEQLPIETVDQYRGQPQASSIKVPSDVTLIKPATDVLLLGSAHAPAGRSVVRMEVSLSVGRLQKTVAVIGDRVWDVGPLSVRASPPRPFIAMPLIWENAFGGVDAPVGAKQPTADNRNPVGRGFRASGGGKALDGAPLPNIEDPCQLIRSWKDKPVPAGFAPLAPSWEPRRSFAGTYDQAWQEGRAPFLPTDFDSRYFQLAPHGLTFPGYLKGDEPVTVCGAALRGDLSLRLPGKTVRVGFTLDNLRQEKTANLDTLVIEPDASHVLLLWRTVLSCDKKMLRVKEVSVH